VLHNAASRRDAVWRRLPGLVSSLNPTFEACRTGKPKQRQAAFIKNYTSQLLYGEPTGTCKTVKRSQEEQRYRHNRLPQTHKLAKFNFWRYRLEHQTRARPEQNY